MDASRAAVLITAGIIFVVSLSTGPLVSMIGVPEPSTVGDSLGEGNATVTVTSAPDTVYIREGGFETSVYYLSVPDAELQIADVRGKPTVSYELDVRDLGYSRSTVHFLAGVENGPFSLNLQRDSLDPDRIDRDQYDGRLRIVLRGEGTGQVIYEDSVRVEVTG